MSLYIYILNKLCEKGLWGKELIKGFLKVKSSMKKACLRNEKKRICIASKKRGKKVKKTVKS